jgi:hypothetical protein
VSICWIKGSRLPAGTPAGSIAPGVPSSREEVHAAETACRHGRNSGDWSLTPINSSAGLAKPPRLSSPLFVGSFVLSILRAGVYLGERRERF